MGVRLALFAAVVLVGCGARAHRVEPHGVATEPVAAPAEPSAPPPSVETPSVEGPPRVLRVLGDGAWRFSEFVTLGPKTADGRSVLAWTWKSVFVVDMATGQPQRTYPLPPTPDPYRNPVVAVAAGPIGGHVAALLADGALLFWSRPGEAPASLVRGTPPEPEHRSTGEEARLAAVVQRRLFFSPDGARLVAGMRIYGVAEERFLLEPRDNELVLDVDDEGREALVATVHRYREVQHLGCVAESNPRISVERVEARRLGAGTKTFMPDLSAAFLPGRRLVQRESQGSTRLAVFDRDTGVRVTRLPSTWRDGLSVSVPSNGQGFWYDDGETSALAAADGTELWTRRGYIGPNPAVQRGYRFQKLAPRGSPSTAFVVRRENPYKEPPRRTSFESVGIEPTLTVFDAKGRALIDDLPADSATWLDGTRLLVARGQAIHTLSIVRNEPHLWRWLPTTGIQRIDVADDGRIGFIDAGRASVVAGDVATELRSPQDPERSVFERIRLGDRGRVFATVSTDARGRWLKGVYSFDSRGSPSGGVSKGSFDIVSRDGRIVVSELTRPSPLQTEFALWDVGQAKRVKVLDFQSSNVWANDQGRSVQGGRTVVLFDGNIGYTEFTIESTEGTPSTRRIKVASTDSLGAWDVSENGQFVAYVDKPMLRVNSLANGSSAFQVPIEQGFRALAVSNQYIAFVDDRGLHMWTIRGREVGIPSFDAQSDVMTSVAIRPDESRIVLGTARGRIWELAFQAARAP